MKENDYILAVYEERSFSKAAKKLFLSQPALSMAVKKIETELGITIFDRSSLTLSLTDEGRIYIDSLEEIRTIERNMRDRLSDMATLNTGKVIVSGENFVSSFIIPAILTEFAKKYAGINVALVESNSPDLRNQLLSENIDLLVAHDFDPNLYEAKKLFEENVLLAVPCGHPVNQKITQYALTEEEIEQNRVFSRPSVHLSEFAEEDFLMLKPGNDLNWRGHDLCSAFHFQPRVKIELDQLITAFNLTRAGLGLSFVTDILVQKTAVKDCLYYRIDHPIAKRTMSIGYKKNRYLTRASSAFIETACEVYQKEKKSEIL